MYKLVQLVSINCPEQKDNVWAIREAFRKKGMRCDRTDAAINILTQRFRDAHKPIESFLFSGIGLTLQNLDSKVTGAILARLMKDNISCLPIHDSYIVEAQHEDTLRQSMDEEYEKVMGFRPVIDKK